MRSRVTFGLLVILGLLINSADAKYPRTGAGIPGKVVSVTSRYFMFETKNGVVKVFVSPNTTFQDHGKDADSSVVKEGLSVRVIGHITMDNVWEAYKVNVVTRLADREPDHVGG